MRRLTWTLRGLLNRLRQRRLDSDLEDEIATHLDSRADDLMRAGLAPDEAHRRAKVEFGALDRYREEAREARQPWRLEHAARDTRYAARSLFRHPVFLVAAAVSIALGTGVNAVLFSAVRAVLFQSPTVTHPERVVWVEPGNSNQFSWANYRDLRDSGVFEATAGFRPVSLSVRVGRAAERAVGLVVTPDFFETLGGATHLGRAFDAAEAHSEPRLVVISFDSWQRRFDRDVGIVGRTVTVNGQPFTIVGVLRDGHVSPAPLHGPEFYVPVSSLMLPDVNRRNNGNGLTVLARLAPGAAPAAAANAVTAVGAELERRFPGENRGAGRPATLRLLSTHAARDVELRTIAIALTLLFSLVLLIACTNVAGLTLARASTRERELTLRAALGATRARVVQLLLVESLLVAFVGTALGMSLTVMAMPFVQSLTIEGLGTMHLPMRPDATLFAYAAVLAVLSALAIGLLPAWRLSRNLREASVLRDGTAGASPRLGLRFAFVVGQVAGAVVLLALAAMLLRSVDSLREHDAGFDLDRAAVVSIHQDAVSFGRDGGLLQTRMLLDALAADGFEQAAVAAIVPLSGEASATRFRTEGAPAESEGVRTLLNTVGARYFETLGIPLRQGRLFDARDQDGSPPVVVVNERLAQLLFLERSAIGQRIESSGDGAVEIVGVVGNTKQRSLGEAPQPLLYYAFEQLPRLSSQVRDLHLHVRTPDDPGRHIRRLETIVRERLGPDAIVVGRTLQDAAASEANLRRAGSQLLAAIGLLGLALTATGLYGAMAFVVATSTRELGIRLALGASNRQILGRTVRRGLMLVLMGLAVGLPLAMIAARALGAAVSGLRPADPVTISGVVALLLVVGAAASYVPARRASRLDPGVVLRQTG